jgi:hypothetical protein
MTKEKSITRHYDCNWLAATEGLDLPFRVFWTNDLSGWVDWGIREKTVGGGDELDFHGEICDNS